MGLLFGRYNKGYEMKLLIACLAVLIILASIVGIIRIVLSQARGDRYWE